MHCSPPSRLLLHLFSRARPHTDGCSRQTSCHRPQRVPWWPHRPSSNSGHLPRPSRSPSPIRSPLLLPASSSMAADLDLDLDPDHGAPSRTSPPCLRMGLPRQIRLGAPQRPMSPPVWRAAPLLSPQTTLKDCRPLPLPHWVGPAAQRPRPIRKPPEAVSDHQLWVQCAGPPPLLAAPWSHSHGSLWGKRYRQRLQEGA